LQIRHGKKHGKRRDHDNPSFFKDPIAHGEGADDPDPDLTQLLRQVDQWLSKLGVETQPSVKFFQGRKERLAVAALLGNVRQR
jgi:hypothetical protein